MPLGQFTYDFMTNLYSLEVLWTRQQSSNHLFPDSWLDVRKDAQDIAGWKMF